MTDHLLDATDEEISMLASLVTLLDDVSHDRLNAGQIGTQLGNILFDFGHVRREALADRLNALSDAEPLFDDAPYDPYGPDSDYWKVALPPVDERRAKVTITAWDTGDTMDELVLDFEVAKLDGSATQEARARYSRDFPTGCVDSIGGRAPDAVLAGFLDDSDAGWQTVEWLEGITVFFAEGEEQASHRAVKHGRTLAMNKLNRLLAAPQRFEPALGNSDCVYEFDGHDTDGTTWWRCITHDDLAPSHDAPCSKFADAN